MQSRVSAVITFLKDGTIVDTDSNCTTLFGFESNELMGVNIVTLLPEPYSQVSLNKYVQ